MKCLVVGIGGAGSRLAPKAASTLGAHCTIVSHDITDEVPGCEFKHVKCAPLTVPSIHAIREMAHIVIDDIRSTLDKYDIILMVANLAGRSGAALAPLISNACNTRLVSFVIMPFGYEQDRLFQAGVSLSYIRENSSSTIILDNDAMLECNPDLSVKSCYTAGNGALLYVMRSTYREMLNGDCIISAGPERDDTDESLRDSIKMLYDTAPPHSVKGSILYMSGDTPVGMVESVSRLTRGITDSPVSVITEESIRSGVVLVSATDSLKKFDSYDPLSAIPHNHRLDWSPECTISEDLNVYKLD